MCKKKNARERSKKYRQTPEGKQKKQELNRNRYLISDEQADEPIDEPILDPEEGSFKDYLWFLFRSFYLNPKKPTFLYRLYRRIKKRKKKRFRDSAP